MWDIAIIGAGLAGLTCARQLKAAGYQVCILDKSRGLGGRMATRRVAHAQHENIRVDHGLRYWPSEAIALQPLTTELLKAGVLQAWDVSAYELYEQDSLKPVSMPPVYVARAGMSAIARHLAKDFIPDDTLLLHYRATHLSPYDQADGGGWRIECEEGKVVMAERCVIAIPAPQAAELLSTCPVEAVDPTAIARIKAVTYDPCLTVLAGYGHPPNLSLPQPKGATSTNGWMVTDTIGTSTRWIGLDSSKRTPTAPSKPSTDTAETTLVIHSKPDFAQRYLDTSDLQPAASVLLRANARKFGDWIAQPSWFQIHRWRYAFVNQPCPQAALPVGESLICGGDWCVAAGETYQNIEAAYVSGLAMAEAFRRK